MNIALVAHDARKQEMLEWVKYNAKELVKHNLYATGTTGKIINEFFEKEKRKLEAYKNQLVGSSPSYTEEFYDKQLEGYKKFNVKMLLSGPLGGDQQIGAMIAEGKINCLIFFCDSLITQGHQQDVSALYRLASLYNIPFASNRTTADMILTSSLWNNPEYNRIIPECISNYKNRKL